MSRLQKMYEEKVRPELQQKFGYKNPMEIPRLKKIALNMGVGEGSKDIKILENLIENLAIICGQRPVMTRAKKAIANFKIREGMPVGARVTLRGDRMYEFLDRLVNIAIPRIRDFRGVSARSFDGHGNYNMGLTELLIFPEVDYDSMPVAQGMNISFETSAETDEEARELLKGLGMPFRAS